MFTSGVAVALWKVRNFKLFRISNPDKYQSYLSGFEILKYWKLSGWALHKIHIESYVSRIGKLCLKNNLFLTSISALSTHGDIVISNRKYHSWMPNPRFKSTTSRFQISGILEVITFSFVADGSWFRYNYTKTKDTRIILGVKDRAVSTSKHVRQLRKGDENWTCHARLGRDRNDFWIWSSVFIPLCYYRT
jgi:hypothetical protein